MSIQLSQRYAVFQWTHQEPQIQQQEKKHHPMLQHRQQFLRRLSLSLRQKVNWLRFIAINNLHYPSPFLITLVNFLSFEKCFYFDWRETSNDDSRAW
jgi:hypothetical protein